MKKKALLAVAIALVCILVFFIFYLILETKKVSKMKCEEMRKISVCNYCCDAFKEHKDYIKNHSDLFAFVNEGLFAEEIREIARISGIESASFKENRDGTITIWLSSLSEKNIYVFIYLIENIVSGVIRFQKIFMAESEKKITAIISISLDYFNVRFKSVDTFLESAHIYEKFDNHADLLSKNIDEACDFRFFAIGSGGSAKFEGVTDGAAFIGGKAYIVGDNINGYVIKSITDDYIVLEKGDDLETILELGDTI